MKTKLLSIMLVFSSITISVNAQLKLSTTGNIAIATSPTPYNWAKLGVLFSSTNVDGINSNYALYVGNVPTTTDHRHYGIFSSSWYSSPVNYSLTIGVYGQAANATSGYNYGVVGILGGSQNGTGIFGAAAGYGLDLIGGNYAGYFIGNVKITNPSNNATLWVNSTSYTSDKRLKKNITPLTTTTFDKISGLNAVEYQYKTKKELIADGITKADTSTAEETVNKNINKKHYGYLAQDVQQIFPELVYEGDDGLLGVDYVGMIPLLIETIKQQGNKIAQMQSDLALCCKSVNTSPQINMNKKANDAGNTNSSLDNSILYQNIPNPFSKETQIKCYIPKETTVAGLYIYNMQGTQLKKIEITDRNNVTIIIQGAELTAGMYMYALIVDGKEVDMKKMILTE